MFETGGDAGLDYPGVSFVPFMLLLNLNPTLNNIHLIAFALM